MVTFYNIIFASEHIITAVGTVNNFILTGEYQVTPHVIKYDLGSNVNYSIQSPPTKIISRFFITTYHLT
jgi:hypothetical protein